VDKTLYSLCLIALCLHVAGCDSPDERLAAFAEKSVDQQAQQNAALAKTTEDVHVERSSLNEQQEALEEDRRDIASQRVREPLIANALGAVGLILACLAPLLICVYALQQAGSTSPEQELGTILVEELTAEEPQLLPTLAPTLHRPEIGAADGPPLLKPAEAPDGQ
jgi:hypothetical protein